MLVGTTNLHCPVSDKGFILTLLRTRKLAYSHNGTRGVMEGNVTKHGLHLGFYQELEIR